MNIFKSSWTVVFLLMLFILLTFTQTSPFPLDDHYLYQRFVETLASGRLDLSIHGFHGSDFFATIWYLIHKSSIAQIEFQIFSAILLPFFAFLAGRTLYKKDSLALIFTIVLSMMPFLLFVSLRGWTGPAYWNLMLLSIAASRRYPWISAFFLSFAILTKPFAVALIPLIFVLQSKKIKISSRIAPFLLIGVICFAYVAIQYFQVGHILVGAHLDIDHRSVWQGPSRILLNIAHIPQIIFSIHNYYFPDPSLTGAGNLMHTTPLLIFLGLLSLFSTPKTEWRYIQRALIFGVIIGFGLNVLLDHMDHYYMATGILCILIASIPELMRRKIWIPLVLATLHFQWFYFYLEFRHIFSLEQSFFMVPLLVDSLFLIICIKNRRIVYDTLRLIW
ncbi:hypothetical protein HN512_02535 [Candidatus Peregrinibacteria bacterium]|jgi:hypothetical protein|nr:hypothetical protein [Candidatus Peregrinibacteria bacterium]MBT3598690.1 hypothetical protein [Candidatus Peregrinibacteria bacterium]MBT4367292.1 hypothetical protein [Candidatus Peregrinibacteria bacterium]MBT4586216.1 hypothetical protein [Candidatus Peregrinibacteria bacterium]MBT6730466.1 hypothetical protein [Candidatus Peregrinibacteria bacterium]